MFFYRKMPRSRSRLFSAYRHFFSLLVLLVASNNALAAYSTSSTSLAFGSVIINSTSSAQTFTFANENSTLPIYITSISASASYNITHNCPLTQSDWVLSPMASCTITVTFTPQATGSIPGSVTIAGDDPGIDSNVTTFSRSIALSGTGISNSSGYLFLQDSIVDFGRVAANIPSSTIPVALSNTGNASVSISSITVSSPFTQTNNCPTSIAPGASCTIDVGVTSSELGQVTGSLSVQGVAPQGEVSDSQRLSAMVEGATLSLSTTSLTFPETEVGTTSESQQITLANSGNVPLENLIFSIEGGFRQSSDCPQALSPGSSCSVSVQAEPVSEGDLTGVLAISAVSGDTPLNESVDLSVHATRSSLVTSVSELDFADSPINQGSETQTLTLTNPGSVAVTISTITTEGDFSQTNTCGTALAANSSCEIQVSFIPQAEGSSTGALSIDTSSGISRIPLSGTATPATSDNPVAELLDPYTGGNPAIRSTARVIGEACPSGRLGARLQEDCNAIVNAAGNGDPNTARALRQVTPESSTMAGNLSRQGGKTQVRNLGGRISALRAGTRGVSFNGLDWRIEGQDLPIELLAEAYRRSQGGGASADNALLASRLGVFVTGDVASGSKDETDLESGLDFDTYGLTMGADYRINNQFILGGALGIMNTQADLDNNAGDMDTQGYSLSLYGSYYSDQNYFIDFAGSYGVNNFDQTRNIVYQLNGLASVDQKLDAEYDGDMYSLFVASGYDFTRSVWTFGPRIDLEYVRSNVDGFSEQVANAAADGGGWAIRVEDMDQTWLTLNLGGRVSYTHSTDWGALIPYARLDWMHEFKDDSQSVNAFFVDDPSPQAIQITSDDPDRDYLRLRLGASAQFQHGLVGFVDFGTLFANSRWSSNNLSLGVRMEF